MIPALFGTDALHRDRLAEDGGALDKLFVRLIFDLFVSDYPTLAYHAGGGQDGAIDLWSDVDASRFVFECKQIGTGIKQQPWEVAKETLKKVQTL
jgi:hypothetical protein